MSSKVQNHEYRFEALRKALQVYSDATQGTPAALDPGTQAAVSVVLRGTNTLDLLMIKRAYFDDDPWSGQMALPGGRRDDTDVDLFQTAIRETMEETALDLGLSAQHLGQLNDLNPSAVHFPELTITPFVFIVEPDTEASIASPEIDQIFWVSIDDLRGHDRSSSVEIPMPNGHKQGFPCYMVEGQPVWGLTFRIISKLLQVLA